jgi:basic membrane protein A
MSWVLDENNAALVTPEMQAAAEAAEAAIASGEIVVHDSSTDGACPAL